MSPEEMAHDQLALERFEREARAAAAVDELREQARKRVEELHRRGVPQAYLYGDTASETYSEMHSFYLLVDRPSVYGLPDNPFNPWLHMMGDYVRATAGGLAAIAALLVVVLLLRS